MVSEEYKRGFADGWAHALDRYRPPMEFLIDAEDIAEERASFRDAKRMAGIRRKPKRKKLSKWQKFVKEKSKLPRFRYKTGKRKGMVNMKAVAAAWKKVPKSKK
jgi:hypothetical protein